MQYDVVGDFEFAAVVIACSVYEQQNELPAVLLGQCLQENLEAFRIGRRHDQIDASSVLRADGAIEVDVFADELGGDLRPRPNGSPARSRAVHPPKARFVDMTRKLQPRLAAIRRARFTASGKPFF